MDKKTVALAMKAIQEIYGYGKPGSHKKKCDICGAFFDEPNDLEILAVNGPSKCPYCGPIIELQKLLADHRDQFMDKQRTNPIEDRNLIQEGPEVQDEFGTTKFFKERESSSEVITYGRTKFVRETIELIEKARNHLYFQVGAQYKILESIYERKDVFWNEGGNLCGFVRDASLQIVVIKLKELLGSSSSLSIAKIRNRLINRKKDIYDRHVIIERKTFKESQDVMETKYPHFPIEEYLRKIDGILAAYKEIIDAMADCRDNLFAHLDELKNDNSPKQMTFLNIKRIFRATKIIYDGLLYSVAPDRYLDLRVEHSMRFDHLNAITHYWKKDHVQTAHRENLSGTDR